MTSTVREFEKQLLDSIKANPERAETALRDLRRHLLDNEILFGDAPLPSSIVPHLLPRPVFDAWGNGAAELVKRLQAYVERVGLREVGTRCGLADEELELVDIDPGYRTLAPSCRLDMVWDGGDAYVVEVNTDSPAMMTYADYVEEYATQSFPFTDTGLTFAKSDRTKALHDTLLELYREWGGTNDSPLIAIIDWPGQKTRYEQQLTARRFRELGTRSIVCSPSEVELRDDGLYHGDERIDVIQRRVLFPDFLKRREELEPILTAYRERKVCVVNPLRSRVLGTKALLALLSEEEGFDVPSLKLPETYLITEKNREVFAKEPTRWVLKPSGDHGGSGVVLGSLSESSDYEAALSRATNSLWVAQEMRPIPRILLPEFSADRSCHLVSQYANWNPFVFNNEFAGTLVRSSLSPLVSITARGALLAGLPVEDA